MVGLLMKLRVGDMLRRSVFKGFWEWADGVGGCVEAKGLVK